MISLFLLSSFFHIYWLESWMFAVLKSGSRSHKCGKLCSKKKSEFILLLTQNKDFQIRLGLIAISTQEYCIPESESRNKEQIQSWLVLVKNSRDDSKRDKSIITFYLIKNLIPT